MKILNADQLREADKYTIENEPVLSVDLMERAASACVEWIVDAGNALGLTADTEIKILCGVGNNGGDGLVMARKLSAHGFAVKAFILEFSDKRSEDFEINLERLSESKAEIIVLNESTFSLELGINDLVIDAIFGYGLKRKIEGWVADVVKTVNASESIVIAIDLPSGMYAENRVEDDLGVIIVADVTLTFQLPKLSFLLPDSGPFAGNWVVVDIGLDRNFIEKVKTEYYLITRQVAAGIYRKRGKYAHKGTQGHALLVGGSKGKTGAMVLAAKSCLRSGAGLATAHIPQCSLVILQTAVPELMVTVDDDEAIITSTGNLEKYKAIGIGPGMGTEKQTQNALKLLIQNSQQPLVIDADGLNILSENPTWLSFLPKESILTPHPGEFKRLTGNWHNGADRLRQQRNLSIKYGVYVILKGPHTSISCPDGKVYFNTSGNPGMATAGSGDVLTGIITALLAQSYSSFEASILGVYLHGLAGDFATDETGEDATIASDIIGKLPKAFIHLSVE